jgi:hypothetical protein
VDPRVARRIARRCHQGQCNRFGEPVIEHVERVAAAVPAEARTAALLHDVLELTRIDRGSLRARGLTALELAALELLTRGTGEPYDAYVQRIVAARGSKGRIARMVKLADLDDHLAHGTLPADAPPYAWARRYVIGRDELLSRPAPATLASP